MVHEYQSNSVVLLGLRWNFENSSYSATEVTKYKDWDISTIVKRAIKLIKFIEKRWEIKFTDSSY